jgi:predicted ATP-dependent endonuclease of OLD family
MKFLTLSVKIEWFKSIESVELDLGDLTILLGPPAAGKSNILDVLGVAGRAKYLKHGGVDRICRELSRIYVSNSIKQISRVISSLLEDST